MPVIRLTWSASGISVAPSIVDKGHTMGFHRSYAIYSGGSNHWNQGVFAVNLNDPEVAAQVKAGVIPTEPF